MAKYFTADPHFSDPFVAVMRGFVRPKWIKDKYQKALELYGLQVAMDEMRDFIEENRIRVKSIADTEAHNKCIVDNINKIVGENDQLWIVGDLAYHLDRKELAYWLDQINAPPPKIGCWCWAIMMTGKRPRFIKDSLELLAID